MTYFHQHHLTIRQYFVFLGPYIFFLLLVNAVNANFTTHVISQSNGLISNNVKSVVGVHTAYSFGLPLRIAVHSDITTYAVGMRKINLISKKMPYYGGEHINFPEMFEKIKPDVKDKGIEQSKKKKR